LVYGFEKHFLKEKTEKKKAPCPGGRGGLSKVFEEKNLSNKKSTTQKFFFKTRRA
jgi:hypothetical protein